MSGPREHNATIDWNNKRIRFNSERCTTWCFKSSPVAYAIPEEEAQEENLITRFYKVQIKKDQSPNDQSVRVKKLSVKGRVPTKRSAKAAGHDPYANEGTHLSGRGQAILGTAIAIGFPHNPSG